MLIQLLNLQQSFVIHNDRSYTYIFEPTHFFTQLWQVQEGQLTSCGTAQDLLAFMFRPFHIQCEAMINPYALNLFPLFSSRYICTVLYIKDILR